MKEIGIYKINKIKILKISKVLIFYGNCHKGKYLWLSFIKSGQYNWNSHSWHYFTALAISEWAISECFTFCTLTSANNSNIFLLQHPQPDFN